MHSHLQHVHLSPGIMAGTPAPATAQYCTAQRHAAQIAKPKNLQKHAAISAVRKDLSPQKKSVL
jgi:hypothetical protein